MTALVILTYNNVADTRACLESIVRHNTAPVKTIVVDNASTDDLRRALRAAMVEVMGDITVWRSPDEAETCLCAADGRLPQASLLCLDENVGYARGNNAALDLVDLDPDIDDVMILNNDVLFVDDIIPGLIKLRATLPDCAVISPILYKGDMQSYDLNCARRDPSVWSMVLDNVLHYPRRMRGRDTFLANPSRYLLLHRPVPDTTLPESMAIDMPSGSCMLIDKEYFRSIGHFDPATFLYYEENILSSRVHTTGRRNYLATRLRCVHLGASTTKTLASKRLIHGSKRSERYYVRRYSGVSAPMRWLHAASTGIYLALYHIQKALFPSR